MSNAIAANNPVAREPKDDPEFRRFAQGLVDRGEQGFAGALVLPEPLSMPQRERLSIRRNEIEVALVPAEERRLRDAVDQFMVSFGKAATPAEADLIARTWCAALAKFPEWAIKKAMGRFMRGEVTAPEIQDKSISRGFAPTTAHVGIVISAILDPYRREIYATNRLLKATVRTVEPTSEQRERGAAILRDIADGIRQRSAARMLSEQEKRANRPKAIDPEASVLREYEAEGIEPHRDHGILISLSILLSRGWTIREINGERVLVRP